MNESQKELFGGFIYNTEGQGSEVSVSMHLHWFCHISFACQGYLTWAVEWKEVNLLCSDWVTLSTDSSCLTSTGMSAIVVQHLLWIFFFEMGRWGNWNIPLPIKKIKVESKEINTLSNYLSSRIYWKVLHMLKVKEKN